jgi:hypothetical protein
VHPTVLARGSYGMAISMSKQKGGRERIAAAAVGNGAEE